MSNNEIIENEEQEEIIEQEEGQGQPSGLGLFVDRIKFWLNSQNKTLVYGTTAVILAVVGFFSYKYFYKMPLEKEGLGAIFETQELFDKDSFKMVLAKAPKLAEKYNGTKAGNLSAYMAGCSYLYTGEYKKAIEFLEKVSFDDKVMQYQVIGLLGDAQIENKDLDAGLKNYLKAAKDADNEFTAVWFYKKAGRVYEKKNDWKNALELYEKIKKDFPESDNLQDIDKYIARAKSKLGQEL